jgi:hypothetical protein
VVLVLLERQAAPGLPFLRQLHWIVTTDHRLRLLGFPMRTTVRESELSTDGQTWDIPTSDAILLRVMCSWTPAGRHCLA